MKTTAINTEKTKRRHWYPEARADKQPSQWWYFGRAIYVSRRDYGKIFLFFLALGLLLGAAGTLFNITLLFNMAVTLAWIGIILLIYSIFGLYRMYGQPAQSYFRKLLKLGEVEGEVVVADIHIGTYRHSYMLANLLSEAWIYSIDCWNVEGPSVEAAVQDVRELEVPPEGHPRLQPALAHNFKLPLSEASCDVVVFGFGTHEIPDDGSREKLFAETERILKPGGKVLLFEHGFDLHNYAIFGPVINHVVKRNEWETILKAHFRNVKYVRSSHAVDLFVATRQTEVEMLNQEATTRFAERVKEVRYA